eukprot:m.155606 g.155606  ORF g.155606 m.155606 type:complete len:63 (+) comp20808_c2_seq2:1291-1479(+)
MRADVELVQEGHDRQHREHAADPQQQAALERIPPMLWFVWFSLRSFPFKERGVRTEKGETKI